MIKTTAEISTVKLEAFSNDQYLLASKDFILPSIQINKLLKYLICFNERVDFFDNVV